MRSYQNLDLKWEQLLSPINLPNTHHLDVSVTPEVIPIVFIPGIMGSKLKCTQTDTHVWDPDNALMMFWRYYAPFSDTQHKVDLLIGRQGHHPDYLTPIHANKRFCRHDSWAQISRAHYQRLNHFLQTIPQTQLLQLCFHLPAFAFSYNWTNAIQASADKLQDYVDVLIHTYQAQNPCKQVLLVTHSMGGLIARAACKNPDFYRRILGVILVAEPRHGVPSLYYRMKQGFEKPNLHLIKTEMANNKEVSLPKHIVAAITANCLGKNGQEVTGLIGNMPGALAMLPSPFYPNPKQPSGWLFAAKNQARGDITDFASQDCYHQIYLRQKKPWSLLHPRDLCLQIPDKLAWKKYCRAIERARVLHEQLETLSMPPHHNLVGTGQPTVHRITVLAYTQRLTHKLLAAGYKIPGTRRPMLNTEVLRCTNRIRRSIFKKPAFAPHVIAGYADGDGTVVDGDQNQAETTRLNGLHHDLAMNDPRVHRLIASRIQIWLYEKIERARREIPCS